MRETKNLEFKEFMTNSFLKTVSAFANYGTGRIMFGIADDGCAVGVAEPKQLCLDIENKINDSLDPVPEYRLSIDNKSSVVTLTVQEGYHKPYLYKGKAYRRNDSATVEADRMELTRLILEGKNTSFDELSAKNQDLTFDLFEQKIKEALDLQTVTQDTMKTLELFSDEYGYNVAAELLSDKNSFDGIDIVRFGNSISILLDRVSSDHVSVLQQYETAIELYRKYYQYDEIKGSLRETVSLVPEEAYREAIANALVHRTWDVSAQINVGMFSDRIEITSPGGLPKGISEEEYLHGGISILRNRILGNVFFRLHMIEHFGTGIRRINEVYAASAVKPTFRIFENSIAIVLPVVVQTAELSESERKIYTLLKAGIYASSEIAEETEFGKSRVLSVLKKLCAKGYVQTIGSGRGTRYTAL